MAYATNVCWQWNLPRQGFDKCVSVCMYVCIEHEFTVQISLVPRLYDKHYYIAQEEIKNKKTYILYISVLLSPLYTHVYDLFCCFRNSVGSPLVSCESSAITTPLGQWIPTLKMKFLCVMFLFSLVRLWNRGVGWGCERGCAGKNEWQRNTVSKIL